MKRYVVLLTVLAFSTTTWGSAIGLLAPSATLTPAVNPALLMGSRVGLGLTPSAGLYLAAGVRPSAGLMPLGGAALGSSLALQAGAGLPPSPNAARLLALQGLGGPSTGSEVTYSHHSFGGEATHHAEWSSTQTSN
jgi:hypothetical protein